MKINYLKRYIISSYVLVWLLIIFAAGSASLIFHAPPVIMWIIRNIIAWSPTYLLLSSFALTFGISILSLLIYSVITGKSMLSYISMETTALPLSIFLSFTSGPTGEELGWRGFMREEFNKKYQEFQQAMAKDSLPANIAERRQKELQDMMQRQEQFQQDAQQQMQKAQTDAMAPIYKKLDDAIKAVGAAEGVIYIFDLARTSIPYVNEAQSINLTNKVKANLGIK